MIDDYKENNDNISEINPVSEGEARDLVCPFISGNGTVINCFTSNCMAWQWTNSVNDNMGICLML